MILTAMTTSYKILALIPARSNSKGLPHKNKRLLHHKPLFLYASDTAQKSRHSVTIIVSTDDPEIANISEENGLEVIHRPSHLAEDSTLMNDVIEHTLKTMQKKYDILLLLQPTSPLRNSEDIDTCLDSLIEGRGQSVISICENIHHPLKSFYNEKNILLPLRKKSDITTPRQELPKIWSCNGAIFCFWIKDFLREKTLLIDPIWGYKMPYERSLDIDDKSHFQIVEAYLEDQQTGSL